MITKQLEYGMTDSQVKELQVWLNANGFTVATSGPGSPGNETNYFGPATQAAVQNFQTAQGIVSSGTSTSTGYGRVGPQTLEKITSIGEQSTSDSGLPSAIQPEEQQQQSQAGAGGATGATEAGGTLNDIPQWLKDSEYFDQLTPDEQQGIMDYYNIIINQGEMNQEVYAAALEEARKNAEPYFAEQIRIMQDELNRAIGEQTGDFESQKRDLELRIAQLKEDLATGTDRLTVDQQSELARQQRSYEYQLEGLLENASNAGLTFSSKRALAENRLSTEQQDIVESTKREFQRKISDLQLAASRGEVEAQNLLADYERIYGENVTSLIRSAEAGMGTSNLPTLPSLPGVSPLGDVTGTLAEEQEADILQRAEALANFNNPFL